MQPEDAHLGQVAHVAIALQVVGHLLGQGQQHGLVLQPGHVLVGVGVNDLRARVGRKKGRMNGRSHASLGPQPGHWLGCAGDRAGLHVLYLLDMSRLE